MDKRESFRYMAACYGIGPLTSYLTHCLLHTLPGMPRNCINTMALNMSGSTQNHGQVTDGGTLKYV